MTGQAETKPGALTVRKRRLFALATLIVGAFAALLVAEVALRVAGYSSPEFYMTDASRGYTLIPGMRGTYRKEGTSRVQINAAGFNDVTHSEEKPAGTVRVAVIGDSYVEALQVDQVDAFWRSMQTKIEECGVFGDRQVEVLRFGVSGYGTAQELLLLRDEVWKYSPDIVMLVMTTNNDITDNARYFKKTPIPYFLYDGGQLRLDDSFQSENTFIARNSGLSRLGIWLKNNLRVVQAIGEIQVAVKYQYRRWKERPQPAAVPDPSGAAITGAPAELGTDSQIYRPPGDENWENAWRVTEGLIDMMKTETEQNGAKFMVVTASNGIQVLPSVDERTAFARLLGVDDLYYPDRRIAGFCRSRSIAVVTLAPVLAAYAEQEHVNLHGFEGNIGYGHWNQLGHKIAGQEIGKGVCSNLSHD